LPTWSRRLPRRYFLLDRALAGPPPRTPRRSTCSTRRVATCSARWANRAREEDKPRSPTRPARSRGIAASRFGRASFPLRGLHDVVANDGVFGPEPRGRELVPRDAYLVDGTVEEAPRWLIRLHRQRNWIPP